MSAAITVIFTEGTVEVVLSWMGGGGKNERTFIGNIIFFNYLILFNRIWIIAPLTNGFRKNFCGIDTVKVTFHSSARGLQQVGVCSTAGTVKPNISQSYKRRPFDMPEIYQKIALK